MWIEKLTVVVICLGCCIHGQRDRVDVKNDLTIDQVILGAMGGTNRVAASLTLPDPNRTLAELDMVLTKKQYDSMYGNSTRTKRKAVSDETVYWTGGKVPYKFAPNHFSGYEQWMIKVAMREWEKFTCVRFHEARPSDSNYVYFQDGLGCNSQLGMVGGMQILNLDKGGCRFKGLYLHEIAHALGVVHEHQRPIRDNYITILYQNVEPSMKIWFQKYNPAAIKSHNVDYELSSVMHYGVKAFSGNQQQTIRAKDQSRESEIGRVYAKELSFTDVEIVNRMYNCVKETSECGGVTCAGKGYLDQNCQCICPDGSEECTSGATRDTSVSNNARTDRENWLCYIWSRQGECQRNPGYMKSNCEKACAQEKKNTQGQHILCENTYDDATCDKWKNEVGDCRVAEHFMKKNCRKSCGYCNDFTINRTPPQTQCMNAHNNDTACEVWGRKGECIINDRWMPLNCRKACFTCPFDEQTVNTVKPSGSTTPTRRPMTTRRPTRPPVITTQPTTRKPVADCVNRYPNKDCDVWARYKHCTINPTFMEANCMLSCKVCQDNDGGVGVTEKTVMNNCKDTWTSPEMCPIWAEHQHCVINPGFMLKRCAKSCRRCTTGLRQAAEQVVQASTENNANTLIGTLSSLSLMLVLLLIIV